MHLAHDQLIQDGAAAGDLAGHLGYHSVAAFSRAFKTRPRHIARRHQTTRDEPTCTAEHELRQMSVCRPSIPSGGGNVGAGYVDRLDGRRFVLTWQADTAAARHRQIAELVGIAHDRAVPAPRYEHVLPVGADVAVLQEQLPGPSAA